MNIILQKISVALLFTGLTLGSTAVQAQTGNQEGGSKGKGALVRKVDYTECITNSLLGIPGGSPCLTMSQEKYVLTPSGNAMSVWQGTVAATARPSKRRVYNSTWNETDQRGVFHSYTTVAVTSSDGSIKLTLTDKKDADGNSTGNGNGRGKGKDKM
ncbi:hypothetical protein [Hymenobacter glacialis]|nr:hypothetical protein [Hymenobacter glacialis]